MFTLDLCIRHTKVTQNQQDHTKCDSESINIKVNRTTKQMIAAVKTYVYVCVYYVYIVHIQICIHTFVSIEINSMINHQKNIFKDVFYCYLCVYVYYSVCMACVCGCLWRSEEGVRVPGATVTGGCELLNLCSQNRMWEFLKSSKFSQLLSHCCSPRKILISKENLYQRRKNNLHNKNLFQLQT